MGLAVGLVIAGLGAGGGIAEIAGGFDSAPDQPEQSALPDQKKADTNAATTVANQRQLLLAAGGQTDYTGGSGVLGDSDLSKAALLGG